METIEIQDEGIVQIMIQERDTAGYIQELFKISGMEFWAVH